MSIGDFAHARDESDSVYFVHARRHISAWRGSCMHDQCTSKSNWLIKYFISLFWFIFFSFVMPQAHFSYPSPVRQIELFKSFGPLRY